MNSFRSNRSWYNLPSNASNNMIRPYTSRDSLRSNRSWDNVPLIASNKLVPSESKTTRIGPFLYSDIYRVNDFPQFSSARNFIEAAIRSSIVRNKLEKNSLINVIILDSEGKRASLPWVMTVADEKNLYDMLLNNMHSPGSDVSESEIDYVTINSSGADKRGGSGLFGGSKSVMTVIDFDDENLCGPISLVLLALYYDHKEAHGRLRKLFPEGPKAPQQFDRFVSKKKVTDSKEACDEKQFDADLKTLKDYNVTVQNTNAKKLQHKFVCRKRLTLKAADDLLRRDSVLYLLVLVYCTEHNQATNSFLWCYR